MKVCLYKKISLLLCLALFGGCASFSVGSVSKVSDVSDESYADDSVMGPPGPEFGGVFDEELSETASESIGSFSSGCILGALAMPLDGTGYQVMHPGRNRFYGHPQLVAFVEDYAAKVYRERGRVVFIGDMALPYGGPIPGSHLSHQSGLDVDIWYWTPGYAANRSLTVEERDDLVPEDAIDKETMELAPSIWNEELIWMIETAAKDPRVDRIFVHHEMKRVFCKRAREVREAKKIKKSQKSKEIPWQRKIRPWWKHTDHYHVRLLCPEGSPECKPGVKMINACGEISWWKSEEAAERGAEYSESVRKYPKLPKRCSKILKTEGL